MDFDQRPELAPDSGPPALLRAAAAEVGAKRLIFADQIVEPDRLMRCGDDETTRELGRRALAEGTCAITPGEWRGRTVQRCCVPTSGCDLETTSA